MYNIYWIHGGNSLQKHPGSKVMDNPLVANKSPFPLPDELPSRGEKIKEIIVLSLLNVVLPSIDVYSDLALMTNFYVGSRFNPYCDEQRIGSSVERFNCHYDNNVPTSNMTYTQHNGWATMLLLPFMMNYLICWYVWATTDERKAVTWVAALLSFYPQYVACNVIWQIWTNPKRGLKKKRLLERNLFQFELDNKNGTRLPDNLIPVQKPNEISIGSTLEE